MSGKTYVKIILPPSQIDIDNICVNGQIVLMKKIKCVRFNIKRKKKR